MGMEISETGRQGQRVKQGETGMNGGVSEMGVTVDIGSLMDL